MSLPIVTYAGYSYLMEGTLATFASGANGARMRLFVNNYYPTKDTLWSDLIEANFIGYVPGVVPFPVDQGLNGLLRDWWKFAPVTFTMTSLPMQAVYGYWIDGLHPITSVRTLIWVKRFNSPFLFTGPGIALPVVLTPGFAQG